MDESKECDVKDCIWCHSPNRTQEPLEKGYLVRSELVWEPAGWVHKKTYLRDGPVINSLTPEWIQRSVDHLDKKMMEKEEMLETIKSFRNNPEYIAKLCETNEKSKV